MACPTSCSSSGASCKVLRAQNAAAVAAAASTCQGSPRLTDRRPGPPRWQVDLGSGAGTELAPTLPACSCVCYSYLSDSTASSGGSSDTDQSWGESRLRLSLHPHLHCPYALLELLNLRADVHERCCVTGRTPLIAAAVSRAPLASLRLLLAYGARVDDVDGALRSALVYALCADDVRQACLLVEHGACTTLAAADIVLAFACDRGHELLVATVIAGQQPPSQQALTACLTAALVNARDGVAFALIGAGADVLDPGVMVAAGYRGFDQAVVKLISSEVRTKVQRLQRP